MGTNEAMKTRATLYTMDDCIYCTMLKSRLKFEKIDYVEVDDEAVIHKMGFETVPQLEVNGNIMDFRGAIAWLNQGLHRKEGK